MFIMDAWKVGSVNIKVKRRLQTFPPLKNWSLHTLETGGGISHFHSDRGNEVAKDDCEGSPLWKRGDRGDLKLF
jgi:hypothetical protein